MERTILSIDANGLCDIIRIAKKSGVIKLQVGDIILDFGQPATEVSPRPSNNKKYKFKDGEMEKDVLQENVNNQTDELDNLSILDPVKHEDMLAMGDFLEGGNGERVNDFRTE